MADGSGGPRPEVVIIRRRAADDLTAAKGGAWKIAYADFVTAMMAFFLLLWLLSSTSKETKDGIADYFTPEQEKTGANDEDGKASFFTPTTGLKDQAGIGFQGGTSPTEDGTKKSEMSPPAIVVGQAPPGQVPDAPTQSPVEAEKEAQLFEKAEEAIKKAFEEDPTFREIKDNIIVEQTPEGLKIQILDQDKYPMFEPGNAKVTEYGQKVLRKLAPLIMRMPNFISVTGHTDSSGTAGANGYTNWELSADRANSSRRFLLTANVEPERIAKVVGMADRELLDPAQPTSSRNRRVSIILLRGSHMNLSNSQQPAARELLSVPKPRNQERSAPKSSAPAVPGSPSAPPGSAFRPSKANPVSAIPSGRIKRDE